MSPSRKKPIASLGRCFWTSRAVARACCMRSADRSSAMIPRCASTISGLISSALRRFINAALVSLAAIWASATRRKAMRVDGCNRAHLL